MTDFETCPDKSLAEYRTLSVSAVVGLVLGLLSPLALAAPLLWGFPLTGVLVSLWSLWRIRRQATIVTGRAVALWGLALSLVFAAAGPADWFVTRWRIEKEARQFAKLWFELLAREQPERAYQLTLSPKLRQPLDDRLWQYYRGAPEWRLKLEQFTEPAPKGESPRLVRTLLALGESARVRYWGTLRHDHEGFLDSVLQRYAVTFEDAGGKKTFFAVLHLGRHHGPDADPEWQILSASGEEKPASAGELEQGEEGSIE
ncbi:MAG: hypothetical protein JXB10_08255 [Pirellulales bacterium]|nr:hypothetical protein [Pirellulales bacterium]